MKEHKISGKIIAVILIIALLIAVVASVSSMPTMVNDTAYEAPTLGGDEAVESITLDITKDTLGGIKTSLAGIDENSFVDSIEDAGAILRSHMVKREKTITVKYQTSGSLDGLMNDIWFESMKHTGVPNEGDYLYYQTRSYSGSYSALKKGGVNMITLTYTVQYYTTAEQEKKVDEKVKKALSSLKLSGKSDYAKIKAIYNYICKNVEYETKGGSDYIRYTAYGALINGRAVCQGYSNLFYRLCLEAGIDTRIVRSKQLNHAWTIGELKGNYYQLDATWDDGRKTYIYFLKGSSDFKDHKNSDDDFKNPEFKAQYKLAKTKYTTK